MTDELLSGDRETVHLFSVDLLEDELWSFVTRDPETGEFPLKDALGVESLDEAQVEGAVVEDLAGIGLTGFLVEGIGVDEALIAPDRTRVDGQTGSVVIVKGAAFDGARVAIHPRPPLFHAGTWHLTAAPSTMEHLTSSAAQGPITPAPGDAPQTVGGRRNRWSLWLLIGIIVILGLGLIFGAFA